MNKPTEHDKQIAREAAYRIKRWEREHGRDADIADMLPEVLAAITAAKQQQNEEVFQVLSMSLDEVWWAYRPKEYGSLCCCMCDANISEAEEHKPDCYHDKLTAIYERVSAARGVQPAVTESAPPVQDVAQFLEELPARIDDALNNECVCGSIQAEHGCDYCSALDRLKREIENQAAAVPIPAFDLRGPLGKAIAEIVGICDQLSLFGNEHYAQQILDRLEVLAVAVSPSPAQEKPVAASVEEVGDDLARMVTSYVEGGLKGGTDWRNGLSGIITLRLRRFATASSPSAEKQEGA